MAQTVHAAQGSPPSKDMHKQDVLLGQARSDLKLTRPETLCMRIRLLQRTVNQEEK